MKPRNLSTPENAEKAMEVTTVSKAHTQYTGVRTPIPATYARELGLEPGDKVSWEMHEDNKGKYLEIRKSKKK